VINNQQHIANAPLQEEATADTNQSNWTRVKTRDEGYEPRQLQDYDGNETESHDDEDESMFFDCIDYENEPFEEDDEDGMEYASDDDENNKTNDDEGSVMYQLLFFIRNRIKLESNTKKHVEYRWLLEHLHQNEFWIRKESAPHISKKLGLGTQLNGYYRDIKVWLPDEEFNIMPICPSCQTNDNIGVHGYNKKTIARRVIGIKLQYYIMSRRYICHSCQRVQNSQKPKYTFMGYNERAVQSLPRQKGLQFPAMMTHKLAIDKSLVDMMRALFDGGIRPNRFCKMVTEMHRKEHTRLALLHEFSDEGKSFPSPSEKQLFSGFYDKQLYDSFVPSPSWFQRCYIKYMLSIREYQDNVLKSRPADILKIDVCYKGVKKFKHVNSQKVVSGIVTIKNECNEVRSQFFVPTDAQDQYKLPLQNMIETMTEVGHPGPRRCSNMAAFLICRLT
jgi:hypothetical protein